MNVFPGFVCLRTRTCDKVFWAEKEILNFMFCWPCISIHLCNKNQIYALFILSLFRQSTSTCFGHICSPLSGGMLYIYNTYQLFYIYIYKGKAVPLQAWSGP